MGQKIKIENKRNKKLKMAIKILIIILVIVIVAFAIYLRQPEKPASADELPDFEAAERRTREYLSDKLIPQHIYDFTKEYKGKLDRNNLYEHLYTISKYLPDLCEDLKKNDAKSYYAENKEEIKKYLGIGNEEDFIKFSEFCKENDVSGLNIEYCAYHQESADMRGQYTNILMDFKYEGMDAITITLGVINEPRTYISEVKVIP